MSPRGLFPLLNRLGNPVVRTLLRSPLHPLASRGLLLITYTGRRSGARYTIPTGYEDRRAPDGSGKVVIAVGWPERKVWWRNLREPAPVELLLRGERLNGTARAVEKDGAVRVEVEVGA